MEWEFLSDCAISLSLPTCMFYVPRWRLVKQGICKQGAQSSGKNQLLCTSIRTELVSKSAISFLNLNGILRVKVHKPRTVRSKLLYNSRFSVLYNLIASLEQLDLYFYTEVARGHLVNKSTHYTDFVHRFRVYHSRVCALNPMKFHSVLRKIWSIC